MPLTPTASLTLLNGLFTLCCALWVALETGLLLREGGALLGAPDRASAWAIIGSVALAGWAAMGCAWLGWGPVGAAERWLGVALMAGGLIWRGWAIWTLGRFFTASVRTQDGQRVVRSGPYRWVRHPSYTGTFATLIGFGLALGTAPGALLMLLIPLPAYLYRIAVEERTLLAALGADYAAYMQATRRLLPGLW